MTPAAQRPVSAWRDVRSRPLCSDRWSLFRLLAATLPLLMFLAGCTAPFGADRVSTRQAYAQVEANALRTGKPSANTDAILHRFELDLLAERQPDEAVRRLHAKALVTGERDLLFALSELSHVAANRVRRSVKPWDARDARDYHLASALYAWLFLFGEGRDALPDPFDRRFREACDFYNYSLGLAFTEDRKTEGALSLSEGRRRLPVGELELQFSDTSLALELQAFDEILPADRFRVRGLSVRNREPGVGAPLICILPVNPQLGVRQASPATLLLRGPSTLAELDTGTAVCSLEVFPSFDGATVSIGGARVPLEIDLTTYRAYTLNQSTIWKLGPLQFLAPAERIASQLVLNQPYDPNRIPVVFVHGTFSSPVTWAEMANSLTADPVLRRRYQMWSFIYGSGNPLVYSIADLRADLEDRVRQLDPGGTNAALRQMVLVGHSQGGLLTKCTAIHTGDQMWRVFSTNRFEEINVTPDQRAQLRRLLFYDPLPFVKRVVFIATPHRGSYLSVGWVRRLGRRLVSLPGAIMSTSTNMLAMMGKSEAGLFFHNRLPTSLDGMSPENPGLLAVAELPVAPPVKAHSIIAVRGGASRGLNEGRDGLVSYQSAHVDYAVSEFIVDSFHTCLDHPATIEEVRRILHEHLEPLPER